jgi:hypothetical protein
MFGSQFAIDFDIKKKTIACLSNETLNEYNFEK